MLYKIILALIFILCSTSLSQTLYETKLTPTDGKEGDSFGRPVKLNYPYLYIGAENDDDPQSDKGSVYIFENEKNSWVFVQKLRSPSNTSTTHFGRAILVDDSALVVAASNDTANGISSGVVYVYNRFDSNLILSQKLYPMGGSSIANFGNSVSMNNNRMLIGAPEDNGIQSLSGAAYLFEKIGSDWVQKEKIVGYDALQLYEFGNSVAISGNYLFIGAPQATDFGSNSGAVYLYEVKNDSVKFVEKLRSSTVSSEYRFGDGISADSNSVAISAPGSIFAQDYSGSVYIYELKGNQWTEKSRILPYDPSAYVFGSSVELKGDSLLIGAIGHIEVGDTGKGYLYIKDQTKWRQINSFQASDGTNLNVFGIACDMERDYIVFGAALQDVFGPNSGAVYVYSENPTGIDDLDPPELDDFILYQNYPNPFNPNTKINYQIPELSFVTIKVYDVLGTEVAILVSAEKTAGSYQVEFNAANLPSAVYFYRLRAGTFTETKKMLILK